MQLARQQRIDKQEAIAELIALRDKLNELKAQERAESDLCSVQAQHARWAAKHVVKQLKLMISGCRAGGITLPMFNPNSVGLLVTMGNDKWMLGMAERYAVVEAYRPYCVSEIKRLWRRTS